MGHPLSGVPQEIVGAGPTTSVTAPCCSSNDRYHAAACPPRPGNAVVPQTSESVRRVSGPVFVRWASLTALAHGPSASKRHSRPPTSISWPEGLKTYLVPAAATPTRKGGRALSRSATLIGKPLCSDTILHTSAATLIVPSRASPTALMRYWDAGLLRPVGLNPP